ncbi:MAG: alpha/beta hydrolase [Gammaproteobacteria bacterium]|nr:alpha/beta hydrolase [Gammaproteobacteria bacterium]MDH3413383.1 alpha/beta hydrolase [Gammaproteobacteria bacterium]
MILKYILLAAAVYAGLCLAVYIFQARLVFLPSRAIAATPARVGLDYEDVWLEASDGVRIHGWYIPHRQPRGTLLFFHGNAGNIGDRLESIAIFHRLNLNVLIIDYHGYGKSEGSPGEAESYKDAEAAWRHLVEARSIPPENIVLFGRSLGGCVAAWLAARVGPAGLILESTFTSVPDMAAKVYPFLPVRLLARIRLDALASLANVRAPILVIHSAGDEIIPPAHGRALFDSAPEPKQFLQLRGGHNDGFLVSREIYLAGLSKFFQEIFPASPVDN